MTSRRTFMKAFTARKPFLFACVAAVLLLSSGALPAHADPLYIGYDPGPAGSGTEQVIAGGGVDFDCTGSGCAPLLVNDASDPSFDYQSNAFVHSDQSPFKGVATIEVTNTGTQSWGDFHFQIFTLAPMSGWSKPSDVFFDISGAYYPTYSNSVGGPAIPLDSVVVTPGTASSGAMLDLYFNTNPVAPGQTAVFSIYTDNTEDQELFGLVMYPSVAETPIPGALWLLGAGLANIGALRRRFIR